MRAVRARPGARVPDAPRTLTAWERLSVLRTRTARRKKAGTRTVRGLTAPAAARRKFTGMRLPPSSPPPPETPSPACAPPLVALGAAPPEPLCGVVVVAVGPVRVGSFGGVLVVVVSVALLSLGVDEVSEVVCCHEE